MKPASYPELILPASLLCTTLACQPVIAIGWREGLFIFLLLALLIGPPVYRFLRRLEKARTHKKK